MLKENMHCAKILFRCETILKASEKVPQAKSRKTAKYLDPFKPQGEH